MDAFRRLVLTASLAGLAAGVVVSLVQATRLWPLLEIAAALEAMTTGAPDHALEGWSRVALTVLFNVAAGIGFGLVLNAAINLLSPDKPCTHAQGVIWGVAGFACFALAPAFGLPPLLPGLEAGAVLARQFWWAGTAACTAGAIALWVFQGGGWAPVAIALVALPHLLGAPATTATGVVPGELAAAFVGASLASSAVFWVVLGGVSGWLRARNVA
jgi:cobalt transporter subunit CbtA